MKKKKTDPKKLLFILVTCIIVIFMVGILPRHSSEESSAEDPEKSSGLLGKALEKNEDTDSADDSKGSENNQNGSGSSFDASDSHMVSRVVDGDTLIVTIKGKDTRVRMIGVDTPESVANDDYLEKSGKENTKEGEIASSFTDNQLTGQFIYLEYDKEKTDEYGRTLAYIWLDADKTQMFQDVLLENGYAETMEIPPNTKYAKRFKTEEQEAKSDGVGFWKNGEFSVGEGDSD